MVQLTNSQLQMYKVQRCQQRIFRCDSISQHLPLSVGQCTAVSEWVIDSFRFGDSCRISELCELVYDGVPNLVCFAWPPGMPLRNMEIPSVWDFPLGAKILVFCPIPAQTHT